MRDTPVKRVLIWAALVWGLSLGPMGEVFGERATNPTAQPAKEVPQEIDEDHDTDALQENPFRPQGPAVDMPQEVVEMLKQRKQVIERREEALRVEEARLTALKKDLEDILARQLQVAKNAQAAQKPIKSKQVDPVATAVDQVVKMYETMPPEEAAARLEKLPTAMALQVLRALKGKTAGTILASVKPDKAAKLTEQFLVRPVNSKPGR